jgi:hypothetical protein
LSARQLTRNQPVASDLELREQNVRAFLDDPARVSPAVREIIERNLKEDLGENGDFYSLNEDYRITSAPARGTPSESLRPAQGG